MYKIACFLLVGLFAAVYAVPYTYDNTHTWIKGNLSIPVPTNAVIGGFHPNGYYTYIGRLGSSEKTVFPARVIAETGYAYFNTESGSFQTVSDYQLLTTKPGVDFVWVRSFDGFEEKAAVSVGTTHWDERVFICRARADSGLLIGTLFLSRKACIIRSYKFDKYEILVARPSSNRHF